MNPYIEPPTIPEGMTCKEYKLKRKGTKRAWGLAATIAAIKLMFG